MVINVGNYKIRTSESGNCYFDLHVIKEGQKGDRKGKMIESPQAYGVTFERALQIIVSETMESDPSQVTLVEFVEQYEKITRHFLDEIKKINISK